MVSAPTLIEAIDAYNEYRQPMADAELVDASGGSFRVRFEGPFCRTCCDYDYFEDLIYELARHDVDPQSVEIAEADYLGDERFVVEFSSRG